MSFLYCITKAASARLAADPTELHSPAVTEVTGTKRNRHAGLRQAMLCGVFALVSSFGFAEEKVFVADKNDAQVYKYDETFTFSATFNTPAISSPDDVALTDTHVYVLDNPGKRPVRYFPDGTAETIGKTFKTPGGADIGDPFGMAIWEGELWVSDDTRKLSKYSLAEAFDGIGTTINAIVQYDFSAQNLKQNGLGIDATSVYILDGEDGKIYKHNRLTGAFINESKRFRDLGNGNLLGLEGVAVHNAVVYVVNTTDSRIYEYEKTNLLFTGVGNASADAFYPLNASNTDPRGIGMEVLSGPTDITLTGGIDGTSVFENSANGTLVGVINVTDPTVGDTFTFALLDDAGGRFMIVGDELQVADGSLLDFEVATSHNVTIQVTDSESNVYSEVVAITVLNVNEAPTDIDLTGSTVVENAANGTAVGTFSTTDPDAGDSHTYSLTDDAGGRFTVVGNELQVADGTLLDFETATSHDITVRTTDAGGLTYDEIFTITVTDAPNEAPTDLTVDGGNLEVFENSANGTAVGTFTVTDPDLGDSHTFTLLDDAGGRFTMDGDVLRVADGSLLDYETNTSHDVTLQVEDSGAQTYSEVFTVQVLNVNETPTDIALAGDTVEENAANDTVVGTLSTTDPDAGDTHTYSLLDNAGGRFKVVGDQVQVADGSLLDFETNTSHDITVRTTDLGGLTYDEIFTIQVTNAPNEGPTDITADGGVLEVEENSANGTAAGSFSVSDPDLGDTFTFTLTDDAGGRFVMNGNQLEVANGLLLDYETNTSHDVTVEVEDSGALTYSEIFTVQVLNVNEAPTDIALAGTTVQEGAANDTLVGTLSTVDPDAGDSHTYSLLDDAGGRFKVVGDQVQVADGSLLDFEIATSHDITVRTTDAGGLTYDEIFTITVTNDTGDDGPTDLTVNDEVLEVNENSPNGTFVGSFSVTDSTPADTFTFSLTDDAGGRFTMNGNELEVANGLLLDYETNTSHQVTVQVQDAALNSYSEIFTVQILDVNENPTDISLAGDTVEENSANGTVVGTLSATDPDAGDSHTFSLTDDAGGRFTVVGTQLQVADGSLLDFETNTSHNITVRATDSGGLTYDEVFLITVTNAPNEGPTDITADGGVLEVEENSANGTAAGSFSVSDPDIADTFTFTLTDDAGGRFTMNGNQLEVANGLLLDYETNTSHDITVQVEDSGALTYSEIFTVQILDVNEAPTDISLAGDTVEENSASGTVVGTLSATDPDAGDSHTFALTDDAGGRFTVVGNELQVADGSLLDFEANTSHDVTVEATDSGGLTFSKIFTITITNAPNEGPTDITVDGGVTDVFENSPSGTLVGTLSVSDPDVGDTFTFSLTDDAGGRFTMVDAELQVADGTLLDFEANTSHDVTVLVEDSGGLTFSKLFTINVLNVNEAPTDIALAGSSVQENSANGTLVGTLSATDPDAGDTHSFSLTDDAGGRFGISGDQLQVSDSSLLDFEAATSHDVTVEAQDAGGLIFSKTFTITVTNAPNEGPTDITVTGGVTNVFENAANGTVVGAMTVSDPDVGDTFTFTMTNTAGGRFTVVGSEMRVANGSLLDFETATSHDVTVQVEDAGGLTFSKIFTINVLNVNEVPTDIALAGSSVVENSPNGTFIGLLSGTDPDAGDSLTFSLTNNAGGRFTIMFGDEIQVANGSLLDFEINTSHIITVQAQDEGGLTRSEDFTITVTNAGNEGPTDITVLGGVTNVNENAPNGTMVGVMVVVDPDGGDTFTFSLTDDAGGRFTMVGDQLQVANGTLLDFEAATSHNVTVLAQDSGALTFSKAFTINVLNVNENPTDITLTNASVPENSAAGTVVGDLAAADPDAGDTFTYSLSNDAGGLFAISGTQLVVAAGADFETNPAPSVTIVVTDAGGLTYSESFAITVTDVVEKPTAVEDVFPGTEEIDMAIPAPGVLLNDTDPGGLPLTAVLVTNAANGTLTLQADGSFTYVPNHNFAGTDTFTYSATNGTETSDPTTVSLQLGDMPDADLTLLKTASADPTPVGQILTYTLTVTNIGNSDAPAAAIVDTLPPNVTVVLTSVPCTLVGSDLTCAVGAIPVGGATSITIDVVPHQEGVMTNVATTLLPQPDPNPFNDTGAVTVTVGSELNGPDLTGNYLQIPTVVCKRNNATDCQVQGKFKITNIGNERCLKPSTTRVFLSEDSMLDGGDTPIARWQARKLKPGGGKSRKFKTSAATGTAFSGKYIITVVDHGNTVLESDESNNSIVYGPIP